MLPPASSDQPLQASNSPFLPLAFRFSVTLGLIVLQLALPADTIHPPVQENIYLAFLLFMFLESIWEAGRSLKRTGHVFATPSLSWIRLNLLLDMILITVLIAFQGADQERFATIYIFPVLASAFYLGIPEIVGVGVLSSVFHILSVLLFAAGVIPAFGHSGPDMELVPSQQVFILSFATLQIFLATLVVVLIRKHMETLRTTLSRSEATVDELSALYRRVFESLFSGIITVDSEGLITSANPAAEEILQRPLHPGTPIQDLGFDDVVHLEPMPKEHRFERSFSTATGIRRILGGNVAPLRGHEGQQMGHLILFQDLTDLKALEERTRLSERLAAVGELSSELAHELRNPVASILGCTQILKQGEQPKAMLDRVLTILRRESERVSAIVSDFLDFTRPRPVKVESCWFPTLMEEIRASWETDPRNEGLSLSMDPLPEIWISGDPVCVHQIFMNLLSNARKAMTGVPVEPIRITFHRALNSLDIRVQDWGCGMSPEQLRSIFLPFSSGFQEGTGLGMSLVFQFIQQMGWDIRVESQVGEGTTVHLSIPLASEPKLFLDLSPERSPLP